MFMQIKRSIESSNPDSDVGEIELTKQQLTIAKLKKSMVLLLMGNLYQLIYNVAIKVRHEHEDESDASCHYIFIGKLEWLNGILYMISRSIANFLPSYASLLLLWKSRNPKYKR